MNIKYSPKQKIIATVLATSIMVTTVSVCLTSAKQNLLVSSAIENTTGNSLVSEMSHKLSESYESMAQALAKNNTSKVQKIAKQTLGELDNIQSKLNERNEEIKVVLEDINSDELNQNQSDYEKEIKNKFSMVEDCLTEISNNKENLKENVQKYSKLFENAQIKDEYIHDPELENVVIEDCQEYDISQAEKISNKVEALALDKASVSEADLELTGDVAISDEIKLKADELKTPYAVYEFVRNNISYEAYYGARKGATGTFDSMAGNDTDTASLLIGMLRYLGYNAKYANGKIRMTVQQAMELTATDNARTATQVLTNLGKDVKLYSSNGEPAYIDMNRTWVEAYVPYTDYRGVGNASGEHKWIPLDASFKKYEIKTMDLEIDRSQYTEYNSNVASAGELLSQLPEYNNVEQYFDVNKQAKWTVPTIVPYEVGYLPLSLEYDVISEKTSSTNRNLVPSDTVTISVGYNLSYTARSADVYNKSITLDYSPASGYDSSLIEKYGDIRNVPSYLLTLVPTINIDDVPVAVGDEFFDAVTPGTKQKMFTTITSSGKTQTETDNVYAGSVYAMVLHYGMISANEYETAYERARNNNLHATTKNTYSSEILGSFLTFAGRTYYSITDVPNLYSKYTYNVSETKLLGLTLIGYELKNETLFGRTVGLIPGNFSIDVGFNTNAVVDLSSETNNSKMFNLVVGFNDSSSESRVWEILLNENGLSSIDVMSASLAAGIDWLYFTSDNMATESEKLNCSESVKSDITNFVNKGFLVIVPEKEITIQDWSGTGFIALNYATGSAIYRLTGQTNGGSTAEDIDLSKASYYANQISDKELDSYVFASLYVVQTLYRCYSVIHYTSLLKNAISLVGSAHAGNLKDVVFGGLDLANSLAAINTDVERYYGSLVCFLDYFVEDDKEAGRKIVENALNYLTDFYKDCENFFNVIGKTCEDKIGGVVDNAFESLTGFGDFSDCLGTLIDFGKNFFGWEIETPWETMQTTYYMHYSFGGLSKLAEQY